MVANTRSQTRNETDTDDIDLRELIASEVGQTLQELLPGLFAQIKSELSQMMDEKIAAAALGAGSSSQAPARGCTYRDFSACQPPLFEGKKDPLISTRWVSEVEGAFRTSFCPDASKVRFATNLLRGAAKDWWDLVVKSRQEAEIEAMMWGEFKSLFMEEYVPPVEVERLTREFLTLEQTTESVHEITRKFYEKSLFCPEYVATERMKIFRFTSLLRTEIREFVIASRCQTFSEVVEMARTREIELETQSKKRKQNQTHAPTTPSKKFKPSGARSETKKTPSACSKCGKNHPGECRLGTNGCYKCGKMGHMSKDCRDGAKWCFNCHQLGHTKYECPKSAGGAVQAPAPSTLRIASGATGSKTEAPKTRGRAFQLTAEDAKKAPDVVTGTILSISVKQHYLCFPYFRCV